MPDDEKPPDLSEIEAAYASVTFGYDEPSQMWMTGATVIEFLTKLGKPLVDSLGQPIDPGTGYYLSDATGLVPMASEEDECTD